MWYKNVLWYNSSSSTMNQWEISTKFLCNIYGSARSKEAPMAAGRKELRLPKQENQSSMICVAQTVQPQQIVLKCCSELIPSLATVEASQSDHLYWFFRSAKEVSVTVFEILDIRWCARDRFFGTSKSNAKPRGRKLLPSCWHALKLRERPPYTQVLQ